MFNYNIFETLECDDAIYDSKSEQIRPGLRDTWPMLHRSDFISFENENTSIIVSIYTKFVKCATSVGWVKVKMIRSGVKMGKKVFLATFYFKKICKKIFCA